MNRRYPVIESVGYLVSIMSVALLAFAAWLAGGGNPALQALIIAGAALAMLGMVLRWFVWWRRHGRRHDR